MLCILWVQVYGPSIIYIVDKIYDLRTTKDFKPEFMIEFEMNYFNSIL